MHETSFQIGVAILLGTALCAFVGSYVWSLAWLYHDANDRGQNGWFLVFLVWFFAWPLGLLLWLALRPAKREGLFITRHLDGSLSCQRCGWLLSGEEGRCANCLLIGGIS